MIINLKDYIHFAIYGNSNFTIDVLEKIKSVQKEKLNEIEINNNNLNYLHSNTDDKFLIIKINDEIICKKEGEYINLDYDIFKNNLKIFIVRTDRNLYWDEWYKNIVKLYKNNKIYVVYNFKLNEKENLPSNIEVIENDKFNKGIYLAYYYILEKNLEGKFLILDDKIIINSTFEENKINKCLFTFEHKWKIDDKYIFELLNVLDNSDKLFLEYEKYEWLGVFKGLSFIDSDILKKINLNHNFINFIKAINNNQYEMAFERVLGILLYYYSNNNEPIFGDIHKELEKNKNPWNYTYDKYYVSKKDKYFNYIFK